MTEHLLRVPTMLRGRFRRVEGVHAPRLYSGSAGAAAVGLREEFLASSRQPDAVMRFLAEMDRKLDAILAHLRKESLAEDFPHEGHILSLSGAGLTLECRDALKAGDCLELLLLLEDYPMRIVPVVARVEAKETGRALTGAGASAYAVTFAAVEEEDRELIIRFVFSEERKRIRQQKSDNGYD